MTGKPAKKRSSGAGSKPRAARASEDRLLGGALRLCQPKDGYRVAIDPVFLAAAVPARPGERVLDLGTGTGAAALCLARRVPGCAVVGLEKQRPIAALASRNAALNGMDGRVEIIAGDLLDLPASLKPGGFDHVMANPPYLPPGRADNRANSAKTPSDVEGEADLRAWVDCALRLVRPRGSVIFIHRADRLDELLAYLRDRAGNAIVIPLWPKPGMQAKRVIVTARKAVATPLVLTAGLVLHEPGGAYTEAAEDILRRGAALDTGTGSIGRTGKPH